MDQARRAELLRAASGALRAAYAPYSAYPVGAAALVDDGRTITGCNVENASYGLSLCAECGLVSQLALTGGGRLTAVCCVNALEAPILPCGRCRQVLWEFADPACLVLTADGAVSLADLLPRAFGAGDLAALD